MRRQDDWSPFFGRRRTGRQPSLVAIIQLVANIGHRAQFHTKTSPAGRRPGGVGAEPPTDQIQGHRFKSHSSSV
jgi:hypothetical protein